MMGKTITDKIDGITNIPKEYLCETPPAPPSVKIELSGRCDLRCGFCALRTRHSQPGVKDDMDINLFKRITTEMRDCGVQEIGLFFLGESFMNPDLLINACEFVKKDLEFPYVFLTTNGTKATPDRVANLMDAGLDSLKFSVNWSDAEQYEKMAGVKAKNMEKALTNIKKAWQIRNLRKFKTGLFASSIQYDGEQQERMEALLDEHVRPYVDEHYWLPLYSMGAQATQREEELGFRPIAGNQGRADAPVAPLPCWSAFTEGHVRCSGMLSACCFGSDERFDMGDLNKQPFMDAWHSQKFRKIRSAHLTRDVSGTVCENCVAYEG